MSTSDSKEKKNRHPPQARPHESQRQWATRIPTRQQVRSTRMYNQHGNAHRLDMAGEEEYVLAHPGRAGSHKLYHPSPIEHSLITPKEFTAGTAE